MVSMTVRMVELYVFPYFESRHSEKKSHFMFCFSVLQKLYTFLFEDILVVTRTATRNGIKCYQVTRLPIPIRSLHLEDVPDGELRTGSFRGAFSSNQSSKRKESFVVEIHPKVKFYIAFSFVAHCIQLKPVQEIRKQLWLSCMRCLFNGRK